jgi:hypothetical protein
MNKQIQIVRGLAYQPNLKVPGHRPYITGALRVHIDNGRSRKMK